MHLKSMQETMTDNRVTPSPGFINAFQLIAMSQDLNLSGLFEEKVNLSGKQKQDLHNIIFFRLFNFKVAELITVQNIGWRQEEGNARIQPHDYGNYRQNRGSSKRLKPLS